MVWKALSVLAALVALSSSLEGESKGYHKFDHLNIKPYDKFKDPLIDNPRQADGDVGNPLYLTPYLDRGDISTAQSLARVTEPLKGVESDQPISYSGFLTVSQETDSHMFFWFFPATEVSAASAPVVVWLQGGPGSSSMYGLFEINGPISAVQGDDGEVTGELNPYSWHRRANMIYIDQPIGTGFSHTYNDGFRDNQVDVGRDLYEMLTQWFTLFPEYQSHDFYVFGESYAGKYIPAITHTIYEENQGDPDIFINLQGFAIGNGATDPVNSFIYAEYMYQIGLIDEQDRDIMLEMEEDFFAAIADDDYLLAQQIDSLEFSYGLGRTGCDYAYDFRQCFNDPAEDDYADYVNLESVRKAIHVGDIGFGRQSGVVYSRLYEDICKSVRPWLEDLLEAGYLTMIYSGATDIICHHTGNVAMLQDLDWSGTAAYLEADNEVYEVNGETAGYITSSDNLRVFVMRNAGHAAPRFQPENAFSMFEDFINGDL